MIDADLPVILITPEDIHRIPDVSFHSTWWERCTFNMMFGFGDYTALAVL